MKRIVVIGLCVSYAEIDFTTRCMYPSRTLSYSPSIVVGVWLFRQCPISEFNHAAMSIVSPMIDNIIYIASI